MSWLSPQASDATVKSAMAPWNTARTPSRSANHPPRGTLIATDSR